ncbi:LptF/LptG family permease [Halobacteriovorax sp. GB3]|uniref:LptF/LptG family permease n=1 Tax=Halobacteriovorax sp. GB3 TaxID=2719615 RepID=UPI0023630BEB|nr:LptF/LptG family permease [Halobacteriovorax sp. GB3]MDD0852611.1 LptF/LptG family permease [Halobacteriovorax sp. GB3]
MLKITERYLAATFIPPFLFSTFFFVTFLLTSQLFRITRIVTKKGVPFWTIFELIGHIGISFLPMAVPLSALFATIYTLNKMSEDSEIVAMRAFGVNKFKLFRPFLIVGIFISLGIFSLNRSIIPYSKTQYKNTLIRLTSKGVLVDIRPEQFFTDIPGVTLFAERVEDDGNVLHNVFIKFKASGKVEEQVVIAKKGIMIKHKIGQWGVPTLRLRLLDGNIYKTGKNNSKEKVIFEQYEFPIIEGRAISNFVTKDSMRTNGELLKEVEKYKALRDSAKNETDKKDAHIKLEKTKLEYWSRFNTPIQCLIFVFLGFCLGIKQGRGRGKNTSAVALGILLVYYALFFTGVSFSKRGQLAPFITVFVPSLMAFLLASYYYRKLDWAS